MLHQFRGLRECFKYALPSFLLVVTSLAFCSDCSVDCATASQFSRFWTYRVKACFVSHNSQHSMCNTLDIPGSQRRSGAKRYSGDFLWHDPAFWKVGWRSFRKQFLASDKELPKWLTQRIMRTAMVVWCWWLGWFGSQSVENVETFSFGFYWRQWYHVKIQHLLGMMADWCLAVHPKYSSHVKKNIIAW